MLRVTKFGLNMRVSFLPAQFGNNRATTDLTPPSVTPLVDYILFLALDPKLDPSPNEVSDTKWVSKSELQEFFRDSCRFPVPFRVDESVSDSFPASSQLFHSVVQTYRRIFPLPMVGQIDGDEARARVSLGCAHPFAPCRGSKGGDGGDHQDVGSTCSTLGQGFAVYKLIRY